jgi:integrase
MANPKLSKTVLTVKGIEAAIKAAKTSGKGREIGDALLPCFYLNVQASGHASFVLRYRHGGRSRKWTIGAWPKMELTQARQLAREAGGDIARGIDVAAQKKVWRRSKAPSGSTSQAQTISTLVHDFLAEHVKKNCRSSTGRSYERWLSIVLDRWGDRDPADIERADVIALVEEVAERAPILANRTAAVIQKLFNWAIAKNRLAVNVATKVEKSKEKPRQRVLTDGELRLLLKAIDKLPDRERDYSRLLLLTLARRGEVGGMRRSELDLDNKRIWTIPAERTKNGREHALPLANEAIAILEARPKDGDLVFMNATKTGRYGSFSQLKDKIDRLIEEANGGAPIAEWNLHDLRRTGASAMPDLDVDLHVVERLMNHRSGSFGGIVSVYQTNKFLKPMRVAAQAWATHLAALNTGNVISLRSA